MESAMSEETWETRPLGELFQLRNGVNADKAAYGRGIRFINVLEVITRTHLLAADAPGRVMLSKAAGASYDVQRGDVLFNRTSETQEEVGLSSVYVDDEPVVFGGFVIRGRPPTESNLDAQYSGYGLRAPSVRSQIIARGQGAIRANIGQADLRTVLVSLPPLPEQRAIAAALSDVDALIASLDRLIAKKRDLKQAAMQQLLTGQTRLPGFSGEWDARMLGEVGRWFSGGTPSMSDDSYWGGTIPWVSPKDMKVARLYDSIDHVTERALGNGTRLAPQHALLVVVRGMILAHSFPVARAERAVAFNQDIKALVVHDVDSDFLLWWLQSHKPSFLALTTESTHGTKRMPMDALQEVEIRVPSLPEQTAIANILSDMDAEITALEKRRDKTKLLKQGMMQELLTGKTRLL